jgi:hypothetical protein
VSEMEPHYRRQAFPGDPGLPGQQSRPAPVLPARGREFDDGEGEDLGWPQVTDWLKRHQVFLIGLGLILIDLIWKSTFLHHFYFRQDDFHFTELALQYGLTWKYLGYVGSGHLHPGVLLLVWILAKTAPYNWAAATWMTLLLVAIASLACLRMLLTLLGNRLAALIPLTLFLVTPLTFPDDSWWTSALESLPLQITIFLAVTSQVHYVRSGRYRHAVAAAFWLVVGLAFFEKAIVIPVLLFAVTAGFLIDARIITSIRVSLGRYWRAWALYAIIVAGYLAVLLPALQHSTVKPKGTSLATTATFSWSLIRQSLLPGLLGGPWGWSQWTNAAVGYSEPTSSWVWLSVFATGAIIVLSIVVRGRAWRAWATLAIWVLLADIVPVLLGRLATAGSSNLLGLDTRYVADAAPVAALCVGLAFWPVVRHDGRASAAEPARRTPDSFAAPAWQVTGVVLTAAVLLGSLLSVSRYEKATALYNYVGKIYLARVKSQLADVRQDTVIVDLPMPQIIEWNIFYGNYANQSRALAPFESQTTMRHVRWEAHFDGTIDRLMKFDRDGVLRFANVHGVRAGAPAGKCASVRKGVATLRFTRPSSPFTYILRIGYLAEAPDAGHSVTIRYGSTKLSLTPQVGLNSAYFSVNGSAAKVTITMPKSTMPKPGGFCIGDVEAGILTTARS